MTILKKLFIQKTLKCNQNIQSSTLIYQQSCYFLNRVWSVAYLGFSRGWERIFQIISKNLSTFFLFLRFIKLIFRGLPSHPRDTYLAIFSALLAKVWKKTGQKRRSPLKISIYWREGSFRKFLVSVSQKLISQNSTKGGPFSSAGVRIPGGRVHPPPPPFNPPLVLIV